MTPKFHTLTVAEVRRETPDAVSLSFDVPAELAADYRFEPGQFLTLKATLPGEGAADTLRRAYSICSGADEGELRVAIKAVPGGRFSTWANTHLKAGDRLEVMTPDGRFGQSVVRDGAARPARGRHLVAFAAGSGITPILSLIRTRLAREPETRFSLVYSNRRATGVLFQEALEDLKNRYMTRFSLYQLFSREPQDVPLFAGRLDGDKVHALVDTLLPVADMDEVFICGPGGMIDGVVAALGQAGVASEKIHVEHFGAPGEVSHRVEAEDAPAARITVVADGMTREVAFRTGDASILDAALAAGIDLPYSCKGGVCCTCRAKVLEGRVRMDKNYTLESPDVAAGYVLSCQAHPLTERVVISFDER